MPDLFLVTEADKVACLRREIEMRERVYPRRIADGKMTISKAEWEVRVMKEILRDYTHGEKR